MKTLTIALVASALVFSPVYAKNQNGKGTSGGQGVGHSTGNQGNDKDVGNAGGSGSGSGGGQGGSGGNGTGSGGNGNGSGGSGQGGGSGGGVTGGSGGSVATQVDRDAYDNRRVQTGVCYKVDWSKRGPKVWRIDRPSCPKNYSLNPRKR